MAGSDNPFHGPRVRGRGRARMPSVFLIARSLEIGGAERQLVELARGLKTRGWRVTLALFYMRGGLLQEAQDAGLQIVDLGKRGRWHFGTFLLRAIRAVRRAKPDIIYGFLGEGNVIAAALRPFAPSARLIWSVRASHQDLHQYSRAHRWGRRLECALSSRPDLIIANSEAGKAFAVASGFPQAKIAVVPNGIDCQRFAPDPSLRNMQRQRFGLDDQAIAVGLVARLDPMKGHSLFLEAAALATRENSRFRFLCIGRGTDGPELRAAAAALGIGERVILAGECDSAAALNALDLLVSSSLWGEGFSNSIAEAMACGLPCVVTDVGDSALIVEGFGMVVPPSAPDRLAAAIVEQARNLDAFDAEGARRRIVDRFSVDAMVDRTIGAFARLSDAATQPLSDRHPNDRGKIT